MARSKRMMALALVVAVLWLFVMGSVYRIVQTHSENASGTGAAACTVQRQTQPAQPLAPLPPEDTLVSAFGVGRLGQGEAEYLMVVGHIDHRSPGTGIHREIT